MQGAGGRLYRGLPIRKRKELPQGGELDIFRREGASSRHLSVSSYWNETAFKKIALIERFQFNEG